jgi:hypothetical protein
MVGAEAGAIITVGAIAVDHDVSKRPPQWGGLFGSKR